MASDTSPIMKMEDVVSDLFESEIQEVEQGCDSSLLNFSGIIRAGLKNSADADAWLHLFKKRTNTHWIVTCRRSTGESAKYAFNKHYSCHRSKLRKTKLSKKNCDCRASLSILIKRDSKHVKKRDRFAWRGLCGRIKIDNRHNHPLDTLQDQKWITRTKQNHEALDRCLQTGVKKKDEISEIQTEPVTLDMYNLINYYINIEPEPCSTAEGEMDDKSEILRNLTIGTACETFTSFSQLMKENQATIKRENVSENDFKHDEQSSVGGVESERGRSSDGLDEQHSEGSVVLDPGSCVTSELRDVTDVNDMNESSLTQLNQSNVGLEQSVTVSNDTEGTQCELCGEVFSSVDSLTRHTQSTHRRPHQCTQCDRAFKERPDLTKHLKQVHGEKKYQCDSCDFRTSYPRGLKIHRDAKHLKLKPHKCSLCDFSCTMKYNLVIHTRAVHEKSRNFICASCGMTFGTSSSRHTHYKFVHRGDRDFACKHCDARFAYKAGFLRHQKRFHNDLLES